MVLARQDVVGGARAFGRVGGLRRRWGQPDPHRIAHMARLVGGQEEVRADEERAAARGMQLHVVFGLGRRIVRNGAKPVGEAVGAGEAAEPPGHRRGPPRIDAEDARVRMRGAQHHRAGLAVDAEIVAEAAATGDEPRVLLAHEGLADEAEAHFPGVRFLVEVGHRGRLFDVSWSSFTMTLRGGATISVRSLSPFGERVGVRGGTELSKELNPSPHPSPSRSRIYPTSAGFKVPNSGKPEFGGRGSRSEPAGGSRKTSRCWDRAGTPLRAPPR